MTRRIFSSISPGVLKVLNIKMRSGTVSINGQNYSGNVSVVNGQVFVDGAATGDKSAEAVFHVSVNGSAESVEVTNGSVTVNGNCGRVTTVSGDVTANENIAGSVETVSGDVKAQLIAGSVSTVSGEIKVSK